MQLLVRELFQGPADLPEQRGVLLVHLRVEILLRMRRMGPIPAVPVRVRMHLLHSSERDAGVFHKQRKNDVQRPVCVPASAGVGVDEEHRDWDRSDSCGAGSGRRSRDDAVLRLAEGRIEEGAVTVCWNP